MPRETRWEIVLDNAAALFSTNGFAATSVREVAQKSRISKAGLYYHIREKEDLLFRICEYSMAAILTGARAAVATGADPVARLRAAMRAHTDFFWEHPHNLGVLNRQMTFLSPERRRRMVDMEREYLELIRGVIREGQRCAVFRAVDATVAAFSLFAMLNTLDGWYDPGGRIGPKALVRQMETLFLSGLAAPRGATHGR